MSRTAKAFSSVLWILLALRPGPGAAGEARIALVAPGASAAPAEGSPAGRPDDAAAIARSIGARILPDEALLEEGSRVVLLTGSSLEALSRWSEERIESLAAVVRRPGSGLVVVGDAAAALPGSKRYSALLGRKHPSSAAVAVPEAKGLPLLVLDQEHPITQCLTHWVLRRGRPTAEGDPGSTALIARAPAPPPPTPPPQESAVTPPDLFRSILWLRKEGAGRVVVLAVEPGLARDEREDGLLSALIARSVEFASGGEILGRLPDKLPLLATAVEGSGANDFRDLPQLTGFFRGRQIAPVMGYGAASWLVREDREETEQPEKVLDSLEIREGATVADLGAGVGYFSFRMARRVGTKGKVLAIDLQPEMVTALKARAAELDLKNVDAILSTEKDPRLPPGSVDLVLMVDVYHELADPVPVMEAVGRSLAPGNGGSSPPGRLVLVEYRGEDPTVPIRPLHRTTLEQVRAELTWLGFRWIETKEFLKHQRVIVFGWKGK